MKISETSIHTVEKEVDPVTENIEKTAGKRKISVTVLEKKDCAMSFLRILAHGDIDSYIERITQDCIISPVESNPA